MVCARTGHDDDGKQRQRQMRVRSAVGAGTRKKEYSGWLMGARGRMERATDSERERIAEGDPIVREEAVGKHSICGCVY